MEAGSFDRGAALQASEQERLKALLDSVTKVDTSGLPPVEVYRLQLKKKRLSALLQQAMREGGLEELASKTRVRPERLSEEDFE